MLSSMRKSAGSWMIKVLLGIIVVAFIFMGAGSFYSRRGATVASVNGEPISVNEYQRTYYTIMENLKQQFGDRLNQDMLKMFNVQQQAIDQLIQKELILQVAEQNDIRMPNKVLAESIQKIPAFQNQGHFDPRLYKRVLSQNRMSPEGFETLQKQAMLTEKVTNLVGNTILVSEAEARAWFNWKNTAVKIDYASFAAEGYKDVEITDEDLKTYFEANSEKYKTQPKVKTRYLRFAPEDYRDQIEITEEEIANYYEDHRSDYEQPETVTARHILLKVDTTADESLSEEKRKAALEIMEKARGGEDFAKLAREYSEGPSAKDGGYLGSFKRGDMVKPFSEKAFAMEIGNISEPVRTQFGWHIIKVEDRQQAATKPLEAVSGQIREKLALQQARNIAYDKALSVYDISFDGDDLVENARDLGYELHTTDFFTKSRGPKDMENARAFAESAFALPLMEISGVEELGSAYFLIQPIEREEPKIPELDTVRERLQADVKRQKQIEAARKAAEDFLNQVKSAESFAAAAKAAGVTLEATDYFKRDEPVPDIGQTQQLAAAAFSLDAENPLADNVIAEGNRFFVIRFQDGKVPSEADFQEKKQETINQLTTQKRQQALNNWLTALRAKSDIEISEQLTQ